MKVNDRKELHTKTPGELKKMLKDGHELLVSLKLDLQQNKLKNTRGIFNTRKNIAIIKTILNGKEGQQEEIKDQKSNLKEEAAEPKVTASAKTSKPAVKKASDKTK